MPIKNIVNYKKNQVCIGSMRNVIDIISSEIDPEETGYTIDRSNSTRVFAGIETKRGTETFNSVNISNDLTHIFYIRYGVTTVEKNYLIEHLEKYYKVIDIENMGENNRYLKITTKQLGINTLNSNWA